MFSDYFLLLLLTTLPLFFRYSLWMYNIQLHGYSLEYFKAYIKSKEGKYIIFNFWFLIEIFLFLFSFALFYHPPLEMIFFNIFFYFLLLQNIFVLGKIFRKKIFIPKLSNRIIGISLFLLSGIIFGFFSIFHFDVHMLLYPYIFILLLLSPIITYIVYNLISFIIPKNQLGLKK